MDQQSSADGPVPDGASPVVGGPTMEGDGDAVAAILGGAERQDGPICKVDRSGADLRPAAVFQRSCECTGIPLQSEALKMRDVAKRHGLRKGRSDVWKYYMELKKCPHYVVCLRCGGLLKYDKSSGSTMPRTRTQREAAGRGPETKRTAG